MVELLEETRANTECTVRTNQVCHIKRSHCLHKPKNYGLRFQSFYALSVYVSGKENFLYGSVSMILVFYVKSYI